MNTLKSSRKIEHISKEKQKVIMKKRMKTLELKITIKKMKAYWIWLNSRMEMIEERISELEDRYFLCIVESLPGNLPGLKITKSPKITRPLQVHPGGTKAQLSRLIQNNSAGASQV